MESFNINDEVFFICLKEHDPVHSTVHRKGTLAELGKMHHPDDDRIFYELKCIKDKRVFTVTTANSMYREEPISLSSYKLLDEPIVLYADPAEVQYITHIKHDKVVVSYVEYGEEYKFDYIAIDKLPSEMQTLIISKL